MGGQPAAFLNGLTSGIETAMKLKNMKMGIDRQTKLDAADDAKRATQAAYAKDIASIDPMQGPKDRFKAALSDWEAQNKNQPVSTGTDLLNPAAPSVPGVSIPAPPKLQGNDVYSAPKNSPVTNAVSAGIQPDTPQVNMQPKPEIEQPTLGDSLNYRAQVLDAKRRAGMDISGDLMELSNFRKKMDDEGLSHTYALFNAGQFDDGVKAFNSIGNHTGWKLDPDSKPTTGNMTINGQQYPTKLVTLINKNGDKRTINTANDMYAMMKLDDMFKFGQKGQELAETNRHNMATEDIGRLNADNKLAAAEAKGKSASNMLASKKAGVGALDIAYGIKRDAMGEILNPSVLSETQKSQYFKDAAAISAMVEQGSDPWAAAEQVTGKTLRRQEEAKVAMPQGSSAAPSGSQASYPTPWK